MDPRTGQIATVHRTTDDGRSFLDRLEEMQRDLGDTAVRSNEELRALGFSVPVPPEDLPRVQGMNRKARRAWAREQRRREAR